MNTAPIKSGLGGGSLGRAVPAILLIALGSLPAAAKDRVVVYPAPPDAGLSQDYKLTVNGKPVDIYRANVWEPNYGKPFGGPYSFAYFDFSGKVELRVTTEKPLNNLQVLPKSRSVKPVVKGKTAVFRLSGPCQLSFEPDGKNGALLIFANPLEQAPAKQGDPNVVYFGPGVHRPGAIELKDDQTLYIAGGALVKGGVRGTGKNIRILGRGILDGIDFPRFKGPTRYPIGLEACTNATIDGIIIRDSWSWNVVPRGCSGVTINNLKIAGSKGENSDGIDIVNSRRVRIENCFIRTDDDSIATKGMDAQGRQAVDDVLVTKSVLWTDRAHIWRLGCESRAEAMRNMRFVDIDVIHWADEWFGDGPMMITLQPAEDMPMENVVFENIRVHGEGQSILIEVRPHFTRWARKQTPGSIGGAAFRDIVVNGAPGKYSIRVEAAGPEHFVRDVRFENVSINGERIGALYPNLVQKDVEGLTFK